jgi:hypothetical protein
MAYNAKCFANKFPEAMPPKLPTAQKFFDNYAIALGVNRCSYAWKCRSISARAGCGVMCRPAIKMSSYTIASSQFGSSMVSVPGARPSPFEKKHLSSISLIFPTVMVDYPK